METLSEDTLHPDLVKYIDGLETLSLDTNTLPDVVDFQLTYGSDTQEDKLLEMLDAGLNESYVAYESGIGQLLSISPDYGVPPSVASSTDLSLDFIRDMPGTLELGKWLHVAQRYLPGAEDEVMRGIVDCVVDAFNSDDFELGIEVAATDKDSWLRGFPLEILRKQLGIRARKLVSVTTEQLCDYANDIETIQAFADSSFMRKFGTESQQAMLQLRIHTLSGGQLSPAQYNLAASALVGTEKSKLSLHFNRILGSAPETVAGVVAEYLDVPRDARLLGATLLSVMGIQGKTKNYDAVVGVVESDAYRSGLTDYVLFIERYLDETGSFRPEHIQKLKSLVEAAESTRPYSTYQAYNILYANLPLDEVLGLLEEYPSSIDYYKAAAVCVRRLAAEGQKEKAFDIARNVRSVHEVQDSVRNLLSIYDETGDESAYAEAEERLHATQDGEETFIPNEVQTYELLVRTFVAARKHGHIERAEQSWANMQPYHTHVDARVRHACLRQVLHMALDNDDLPTAEHFAGQLHISMAQRGGPYRQEELFAGLFHVLHAYKKADDMEAATNLVQTYFTDGRPYSIFQTAVSILKDGAPKSSLPSLYTEAGSRVNAITALMDRRGGL